MPYGYTILAPSLQATADAAIAWFIAQWGVSKTAVKVEAAVHNDVSFRPTFTVPTRDFHILSIEVAETIYTNALDSFVLDCREQGLPIKLYVAVPKGQQDPQYSKKLRDARRAGVGILEVDSESGTVIQNALSLSLANVRPIDPANFPLRYRESLHQAQQSFRDGQPAKACSQVYDELEGAFRRFAKKCEAKNLWKNKNTLNVEKAPWATLITDVDRGLDRSSAMTKPVTKALMARILGTTAHRNESGHKPNNLKQLITRDTELRTRFESAVDLLREFLDDTKSFRV